MTGNLIFPIVRARRVVTWGFRINRNRIGSGSGEFRGKKSQ